MIVDLDLKDFVVTPEYLSKFIKENLNMIIAKSILDEMGKKDYKIVHTIVPFGVDTMIGNFETDFTEHCTWPKIKG